VAVVAEEEVAAPAAAVGAADIVAVAGVVAADIVAVVVATAGVAIEAVGAGA
jgi:hypothetical protein